MSTEHSATPDAPAGLFDLKAASTARPVVPLADATEAKQATSRRSWLISAIAVSALVGSLTGIAAFSFYQRRAQSRRVVPPQQLAPQQLAPQQAAAPVIPAATTPPTAAPLETVISEKPAATVTVAPAATPTETVKASGGKVEQAKTDEPKTAARAERRSNEVAPKEDAKARDERAARRQTERPGAQPVVAATPAERATPPASRQRRTVTPREDARPKEDEPRAARPGYVDDVRRAIGDRPTRRGRRQSNTNGERVREIFEGATPPRR